MNRIDYAEALGRARAYMHQHLGDDLRLDALASVSGLSPHHWHRLYHGFYGETAATTVKRIRLHHAASQLVQTALPVHQIASDLGYPNLQSFSRVFRNAYGMPPASYRRRGGHAPFLAGSRVLPAGDYDVRIEAFPAFPVAASPHTGPYLEIAVAFDRLYGWLLSHDRNPAEARHFGLYHDDPFAIPADRLRSHAAITIVNPPAFVPGLERLVAPAGTYAVLRYRGPYASMHAAYQWLFGVWVIDSGYAVGPGPLVEEYLNDPATTPPGDLLTDIRMPIQVSESVS